VEQSSGTLRPTSRGTGTPKDKDDVNLFEVELKKPRNLSASESCLLLIDKARARDKTYI
jgi:hypothetical protein